MHFYKSLLIFRYLLLDQAVRALRELTCILVACQNQWHSWTWRISFLSVGISLLQEFYMTKRQVHHFEIYTFVCRIAANYTRLDTSDPSWRSVPQIPVFHFPCHCSSPPFPHPPFLLPFHLKAKDLFSCLVWIFKFALVYYEFISFRLPSVVLILTSCFFFFFFFVWIKNANNCLYLFDLKWCRYSVVWFQNCTGRASLYCAQQGMATRKSWCIEKCTCHVYDDVCLFQQLTYTTSHIFLGVICKAQ